MSLPEKYDDVLVPFLTLMRRELHANCRKGDRPGWLRMDANTALLEIYWHAAKLSAAVKNNDGPAIMEYGADVANMAMMVLDICGGLAWVEPVVGLHLTARSDLPSMPPPAASLPVSAPAGQEAMNLVDWLGLALELEAQAKRVESQTAERAMLAAANGLRLMGPEHSAKNDRFDACRCICSCTVRPANCRLNVPRPMPVERIAMLWNSLPLETDPESVVAFVRAVERFHGVAAAMSATTKEN